MANTDGGAHVDPRLDAEYEALKAYSATWRYFWEPDGGERHEATFDNDVVFVSVRQIAHEVIRTLANVQWLERVETPRADPRDFSTPRFPGYRGASGLSALSFQSAGESNTAWGPGSAAVQATPLNEGTRRQRRRGTDGKGIKALRDALDKEGATLYVIAPTSGSVRGKSGSVPVDRTVLTTQSVEYDALVVAGGNSDAPLAADIYTALNVGEAFRHHKVLAAWGEGQSALEECGVAGAPGVVVGRSVDKAFTRELIEAMGWHRHWDREPVRLVR